MELLNVTRKGLGGQSSMAHQIQCISGKVLGVSLSGDTMKRSMGDGVPKWAMEGEFMISMCCHGNHESNSK